MKKFYIGGVVLIALLVLALLWWTFVPQPTSKSLAAICRIEARSCYAIALSAKDTLYLSPQLERTLKVSAVADSVSETVDISGCFISRAGHVLTTDSLVYRNSDVLADSVLRTRLDMADSLLSQTMQRRKVELKELNRYAKRHSVVDDGYNEVMDYRTHVQNELAAIELAAEKVQRALTAPVLSARLQVDFHVLSSVTSQSFAAHQVLRKDRILMLQLNKACLPRGAERFSVYRLGAYSWKSRLHAYNDFGGETALNQPVQLSADAPRYPSTEGGAWVNASGNLCGIQCGKERIGSFKIGSFVSRLHFWPTWWRINLIQWIEDLRAKHHSVSTVKKNKETTKLQCAHYLLPDSSEYKGQVIPGNANAKFVRQGYGTLTTKKGSVYRGYWQADTLVSGQRDDAGGHYSGRFDSKLRAQGYGSYTLLNGEHYSGNWEKGIRTGLGFSSKPGRVVYCGNWRKGRFLGERMVYTSDRVYGIDISRYQHDVKKHVYPINWSALRITSLGTGRRVKGNVDYPVSFVYIKSTEGKSVLNRYYRRDAYEARRRGLAVGTYHFYSPYTSPLEQVEFFLKKSVIARNDLPPMLDLEPSERQVRMMGGDSIMFHNVLIWLKRVEQHCGKRPILYVGQNFVNKHLVNAPEELREYDVWIARYGEYKPYVHLLYWQLTPYGRVRGIHGEVDVNVFNGTKEQFCEYRNQFIKP